MAVEVLYELQKLEPFELIGELVYETKLTGLIDNFPTRRSAMPYEKIELMADNDRTLRLLIRDKNLDVIDITGGTGVFTVRTKKSGPIIMAKSTATAAEGTLGAADEGELFFYILPADTISLDTRQYVFDMQITLSSGKKYTVMEGLINLQNPVT